MQQEEELELARVLAKLTRNGFSVFAQYDFARGTDILKGILISPGNKDAGLTLERIAELITTQKGLSVKT